MSQSRKSTWWQRLGTHLGACLLLFSSLAAAQVTTTITVSPNPPLLRTVFEMRVTHSNASATPAVTSAQYGVFLPIGLQFQPTFSGTCGTPEVTTNAAVFRPGFTVPANGSCVSVFRVLLNTPPTTSIATDEFVTSTGTFPRGQLTLMVSSTQAPTVQFAFSPSVSYVATPVTLAATINTFSDEPTQILQDLSFSIPAGTRFFGPPRSVGSCSGVVVSGSTLTLPAGTVLSPGACTMAAIIEGIPPVQAAAFTSSIGELVAIGTISRLNVRLASTESTLQIIDGSASMFAVSEGREPIGGGNGAIYRAPFGSAQAVIAPVMEPLQSLPADYSIVGRVVGGDGTIWEFVLSNFDNATSQYGTARLGCLTDTTNQCISYYTGINPISEVASRAGAYISRTPAGSTTPQNCQIIDTARSRFVVQSVRYARDPREVGAGEDIGLNLTWEPVKARARAAGISTLQRYTSGRRVTDVHNFAFDFDVWCLDGVEANTPPGGRIFGAMRWLNSASNAFFAGEQRRGDDIVFRRVFGRKLDETLIYVRGTVDSIVGGETVYSAARADISARPLNGDILRGVSFRAVGPRLDLSVDVSAAFSQVLTTNCRSGVCFNHALATRASSKDDRETGVDIRINGRSCTALTGGFAIREAFFDGNRVDRFAADLDFTCAGEGPSRVEIRYNSDIAWNDRDEDGITDGAEVSSLRNDFEPDNYLLPENRIDGNGLFARQQFRDFYAQEGSIGSYTRIGFDMDAGVIDRTGVVLNFFNSQEFYQVVSPIARVYLATLGRQADATGLNYWVTRFRSLNRPLTLVDMASLFVTSPEFIATFGNSDNQAFVNRLYLNVLRRPADAAGLSFWTGQLNAGQLTRPQMVLAFSESREFQALTLNEINVVLLYYAMLRRDATPTFFNTWVSRLNAGTLTIAQLIQTIWRSQEYCYRFSEASYCRSVSPPTDL
jgi:hypothetical protein